MIARLFRLDPVEVLKSNYTDWTIRSVSYDIVAEHERVKNPGEVKGVEE